MKRIAIWLVLAALLLGLCGCGEAEGFGFRTLEVIGTRHYNVICRKDDRLAPQIDAAMKALAYTGELSSISLRWLGRDAVTLKGEAPGTPAPEETEPETAPRRLIVGVEENFNPMAFQENGVLRGMSVDIADALARTLGWDVAYQTISPAEVGTQLASGNIDCALGFDPGTVNPEKYSVGVGYLDSDIVLAVRQGSAVKRLRDLRDRRVGTVDDPTVAAAVRSYEKLTKYAAGATAYLTPARCVSALDNGWCAAVAMDAIMLEHLNAS